MLDVFLSQPKAILSGTGQNFQTESWKGAQLVAGVILRDQWSNQDPAEFGAVKISKS